MPDKNQHIAALASFLRDLDGFPPQNRHNPESIAKLLLKYELFDPAYYAARYQETALSSFDAACHFARLGYKENRIPAAWLEECQEAQNLPVPCENPETFFYNALAKISRQAGNQPVLLRQGSYEALNNLPLYVHWSITSKCNYRCSYCSHFYGKENRLAPEPTYEMLLAAVDRLAALNRPAYQFVLLGGEPTVCPWLPELIEYIDYKLKDRFKQLVLVTNGSRSVEYLNRFANLSKRVYIQIMHSIHLEFEDPERLFSIVENLHPAMDLNLLLMVHPEKMTLAREIFEKLCLLRFKAPFHLFLQTIYELPDFTRPDSRYPKDFFEWRDKNQNLFLQLDNLSPIKRSAFISPFSGFFWEFYENGRIAAHPAGERGSDADKGWLDFKDKYCVGGAHLIRIHEDGQVMGTTCGLMPTGINIYTDDLDENKFMRMLRCPKSFCACSDNDLLMKFASKNEAQAFLELAKSRQADMKKIAPANS